MILQFFTMKEFGGMTKTPIIILCFEKELSLLSIPSNPEDNLLHFSSLKIRFVKSSIYSLISIYPLEKKSNEKVFLIFCPMIVRIQNPKIMASKKRAPLWKDSTKNLQERSLSPSFSISMLSIPMDTMLFSKSLKMYPRDFSFSSPVKPQKRSFRRYNHVLLLSIPMASCEV